MLYDCSITEEMLLYIWIMLVTPKHYYHNKLLVLSSATTLTAQLHYGRGIPKNPAPGYYNVNDYTISLCCLMTYRNRHSDSCNRSTSTSSNVVVAVIASRKWVAPIVFLFVWLKEH